MSDRRCRALILAAGRGRRLGDAGATGPKCLVPLAGRSLLDWQLQALHDAGIDEVALVGGYRNARLRRPGITLFVNRAWERTNMVASLYAAASWLREAPSMVAYGDIVYHPRLAATLVASDADIAITYDRLWQALWRARFTRPQDDAESLRVAHGRVLEIGARVETLEHVEGQYMGLLRITPRGWATIVHHLGRVPARERDRMDMTTLLQQLVTAGVPVRALPVEGRWCEVDYPSDLALYERMATHRTEWTHDWRP